MKIPSLILTLGTIAMLLVSCEPRGTGTSNATRVSTSNESIEKDLIQLEHDWADASVKHDVTTLGRIMADDWSVIDWNGEVHDKAKAIAEVPLGHTTSLDLEPMKVRVFGDMAIVTGGDVETSTFNGKDTSGRYLWMDVFAKRDGKWQAVASESTKAAPVKP